MQYNKVNKEEEHKKKKRKATIHNGNKVKMSAK